MGTGHAGLTSRDVELDFTVWWEGVESFEPKNYVTSLMNVHVENGMQKGQNRSRDFTDETQESKSQDGGGDRVDGVDIYFEGRVNKPCIDCRGGQRNQE